MKRTLNLFGMDNALPREEVTLSRFILHISHAILSVMISLLLVPCFPCASTHAQASITFTEVWFDEANDYTMSIAWGDIDGDGNLDLVVGNHNSVNRIYRNDGSGVFEEIVGALGFTPDGTHSVTLGDMDGDGDLDLAVGNEGKNRLYRNEGDDVFTELEDALGVYTDTTYSVAWGDMDSDGDLDLVVGNGPQWDSDCECEVGGENRLYRNEGDGRLTEVLNALTSITDTTRSVAWGDIDGDEDLDLAIGNYGSLSRIYRNEGGGVFVEIPDALDFIAGTESVAWGDMDGDNDLDLAVGNSCYWDGNTYVCVEDRLYRNDGSEIFTSASTLDTATDATTSVVWGDMDGDGDLDLATAGGTRLYRNEGNGDFIELDGLFGSTPGYDFSIAWGDMDGDGDLDLAVGNVYINYLYRNEGANLFETEDALGSDNDETHSLAWGDIDGDGDLDLAIGNYGVSRLYRNEGNNIFVEALGALGVYTDSTESIAWGDMDSDGDLDLAIGNYGVWDGSQYVRGINRVYENVGGEHFSEVIDALGDATGYTFCVAWGDMDGDGDLDLAVGQLGLNRLYRNEGNSQFAELFGALGNVNDYTKDIAWGDMDGDGDLDLAVGNFQQVDRVYRNEGKGVFAEVEGALGDNTDYTSSIAWGDMDGDGDLDLVVGNWGMNRLYRNEGGESFVEIPVAFGHTTDTTESVAWGDMDGDGDLDLVVGNSGQVNRVYANIGKGSFIEIADALGPATNATLSVAWGDIDDDGDLDLAVGNNGQMNQVYANTRQDSAPVLPDNAPYIAVNQPYTLTAADFYALSGYLSNSIIPITYILFDPEGDPVGSIAATYSLNGGDNWQPAIATPGTINTHLTASSLGVTHVYTWDTFASGFFGQSDNVVLRMVAYPQPATAAVTGTYKYYNNTPGPFQHPYASATTFPIRVRGTQVRVYSETVETGHEAVGAMVYRWSEGSGGSLLADSGGTPFHTDQNGYLKGRGTIALDDQLLAILPVSTIQYYAGALAFDGADDYAISTPFYTDLITETTVAFWMRSEDTTNAGTPLSYATVDNSDDFLITNYNNFTIQREWDSVSTGITATDGIWHHIAVTWRNSDGQTKLYKDGVAVFTATTLSTGSTMLPEGSLVLGQDQDNFGDGFEASQAFRGSLDEVYIWNVALSGSQVQDAMFGIVEDTRDNLVAAWSFDDPADPGVDSSSNANHLILEDATWDGDYLGGYTVYHTNGVPTVDGVEAFTVTQPGVQEIAVTAAHPLILFDLNLSLEWDAHNDPMYLQQLEIDLKKASAYLYDFTNGQVALGKVTVHQNADYWASSHIAVQASNRLRPFASIGGLPLEVFTETVTVNGQEHTLTYGPGQIRMGATWNRYGDPAASIGEDWPLILAHELSHYLLYQYDVYIGLNEDGLLVPEDACTGSAMGDVYAIDNTEFISDTLHWTTWCSQTLAAKTLGRTEWETLRTWYPWLITPTLANEGPSQMPFEFTTVEIVAPTQAQDTIEDPTFYLDYAGGLVSSSEARAFLLRDADDAALPGPDDFEYIYDLGSPIGGQNRVTARGARPGDRLCVFDNTRAQFGCEVIAAGDERMTLKADATWQPVIQLTPVNSTTFILQITELASITNTLRARIFPEFSTVFTPTTLAYVDGIYTATLTLSYPVMSGHVQVRVDEPTSETYPRREAMVNFSIGGNPGTSRASGIGTSRASGIGTSRASGIGSLYVGEAPLVSPDGQMILYLSDVITFAEGQFYTIQAMAGLPDPPPGRTPVGQGYNLVATGFLTDTSTFTGSVSIQYLGNDVLVAGVDENDLVIYFWDGTDWTALDTVLNTTYNMASARSQGTGIYALMASVKLSLYGPGWNLISYPLRDTPAVTQALLSISGYYTTVYGYKADDPDDPWKVYDIIAPKWVNDLAALEFGKGYWINVSQAITLYLSSSAMALAPTSLQATLPLPPATFYGTINTAAAWMPKAEMPVTAWIDGTLCGQTSARQVDGQVVYAVNVFADDLRTGCGAPGKRVTFQVDGRTMAPAVLWDDRQLWPVTLRPAWQVYLPLVMKSWP